MNLFGCLFPCALQQSWWSGSSSGGGGGAGERCMTEEFVRRMGVSASSSSSAAAMSGGGGGLGDFFGSGSGGTTIMTEQPPASSLQQLQQRKKKPSTGGFATLRKKFIRRRRSSKACDHGRVLRELVAEWASGGAACGDCCGGGGGETAAVGALLDEYEALAALKDLCVQAELARPPAATFKQDLGALYERKHCTDADLVYRGACFPVHRALLSARCPYFRDLLAGCPGYGARICLELRAPAAVDVALFSALLRYLYTGDIASSTTSTTTTTTTTAYNNLEEAPGVDATAATTTTGVVVDTGVLRRLRDEFGTPNALETDLRYLLETGDYADAALVFTSDSCGGGGFAPAGHPHAIPSSSMVGVGECQRPDSGSSEYGFRPKLELPCHKAILSARSPFFRSLLQRRSRSGEEHTERALHIPTRIVLDETVIPKRYARVLLHAVYLDQVDLSLIARSGGGSGGGGGGGCLAAGSVGLGEAAALAAARPPSRPSALEEAMELYQIGRFLELDILAQGCEDAILELLALDTLPAVLAWARQPHGSAWVHRQALHYLREEFQPVAASPVLHQLDRVHLAAALRSPFLQASELEVLHAVLKWGEHELVRRMEDREPNLLNHTAHSVTRKGVKKRDLSDVELREILADLLPLVRVDHVLPPTADALAAAIRRGLVSTPPSHMLGGDGASMRMSAWIRCGGGCGCGGGKYHHHHHHHHHHHQQHNGLFVQPRLFMPYYEEAKALVEERLVAQQQQEAVGGGSSGGVMRSRRMRQHHQCQQPPPPHVVVQQQQQQQMDELDEDVEDIIPDALYMLAAAPRGVDVLLGSAAAAAAAAAASLPAPEPATMAAMRRREAKLRQAPACQRALHLPLASRRAIARQIRLRVVREFNLPDAVAEMLEAYGTTTTTSTAASNVVEAASTTPTVPPAGSTRRGAASCYGRHLTFPRQSTTTTTSSTTHRLPAPTLNAAAVVAAAVTTNTTSATCSDGYLSDVMPDVAMATATLGQLQLAEHHHHHHHQHQRHLQQQQHSLHHLQQQQQQAQREQMELDLGDGAAHHLVTPPLPELAAAYRRYPPPTLAAYHRPPPPLQQQQQQQRATASPAVVEPPPAYHPTMPRFL